MSSAENDKKEQRLCNSDNRNMSFGEFVNHRQACTHKESGRDSINKIVTIFLAFLLRLSKSGSVTDPSPDPFSPLSITCKRRNKNYQDSKECI